MLRGNTWYKFSITTRKVNTNLPKTLTESVNVIEYVCVFGQSYSNFMHDGMKQGTKHTDSKLTKRTLRLHFGVTRSFVTTPPTAAAAAFAATTNSSVRSLDWLGRRRDMIDDSTQILFQSSLQEAVVSSSGLGRGVDTLFDVDSELVGALSPVDQKGLHQTWKQTSI